MSDDLVYFITQSGLSSWHWMILLPWFASSCSLRNCCSLAVTCWTANHHVLCWRLRDQQTCFRSMYHSFIHSLSWGNPMRKNWPPWLLTVISWWAHGDQNRHSQPWPGPWLSCDWAVIELWPSRDWAVTELWPSLAVTEPWSLGPGAVTTVSSPWAHRDHLFSRGISHLVQPHNKAVKPSISSRLMNTSLGPDQLIFTTKYRLVSNIRCTSNIRRTPTLGNSQLEFSPTISLAKTSNTRCTPSFDFLSVDCWQSAK